MAKKGSITVFLALMLSLMVSLICTSIESVRMAAARTQILCGLDVGLYSLFGQFDKTALKDYDLFLIDGSCGGGNLKMANIYHNMESYMEPILKQNSQKLSIEQGGFTGYQLLTDEGGEIFFQQIVQYMQDTLGSQGAQLLFNKMQDRQKQTEKAIERGTEAENGNALECYESEIDSAETNSRALEEQNRISGSSGTEIVVVKPQKPAVNPINSIKKVMKMSILDLVLPPGKNISTEQVKKNSLPSYRSLQSGTGLVRHINVDSSFSSQLLYQEYLMQKLGNYQTPAENGLAYQLEYILYGKQADKDNLSSMAKKLLLIREGVNITSLMSDPVKRTSVEALSVAIASGFLVPPAAGAIEAALVLCWSFAESILDVRELFAGGKVPLVKTAEQWQISLENLPYLLGNLDSLRKNDAGGLSYEDYIQILLLAKTKAEKIKKGMDMIELSIRKKTGNEQFKLDSGIVAIEASVDVKANRRKTFTVTKQYSYD